MHPIHRLQKTLRSFTFAFKGIVLVFRHENNTRIHLAATLVAVFAGWYLGLSPVEWALVITQIGLVWAAEAFNSAIEKVVDFVSPDLHPQAGAIKDIAAGAVLFVSVAAAATGTILFGHRIMQLWF